MIEKLIKECQKRNKKAQSELFYLYRDKLFALCLKYCKNVEEAEDNLQDAFITIFKNIQHYKFSGSFEGWMKRITINKAIDRYKKSNLSTLPINNEILAEPKITSDTINFTLDELLEFIQRLPDRYRLVFNLYELDDYSHKEIAAMLNISQGTSKSNLHRAKTLLKEYILSSKKEQKKTIVVNG